MKAVILAGGHGSRLWPLSTKEKPKQFQKLIGNKTMLQQTLDRLSFLSPKDIYIATNKEYIETVIKQTASYKIPRTQIIEEPAMRDTAPCIGLAATLIAQKHPQEVMAVIYADHLIQNKKEFKEKLKIAEKIAREDKTLNIIEVKARFPNTNLGYVKIGHPFKEIGDATIYDFEKFTEKPDARTAEKFLKSYKYLWNTGLYVWRVDVILDYYKKFLPRTYKNLLSIKKDSSEKNIVTKYPLCDKISIDYGIMEKVPPHLVKIIPAELGWNDIGTWESIWEELPHDKNGNLVRALGHKSLETRNCLIYGDGKKPVITIGVKDLIIVDTKEGLLICKKEKSGKIKEI